MSTEMFESVRAAEAKADAILSAAQRESLKLIKDTEAECLRAERETAKEHRALYQSILEAKRDAVAHELDARAVKERESISARMEAARGRLSEAAQSIAERVWSNGNR